MQKEDLNKLILIYFWYRFGQSFKAVNDMNDKFIIVHQKTTNKIETE